MTRVEQVAELSRRGLSPAEIGLELGISADCARVYRSKARAAGHAVPELPKGPAPRRRWEVLRLLKRGLSVAEVAGELGMSRAAIHRNIWKARRRGEAEFLPRTKPQAFVGLNRATAKRLAAHAAARGVSVQELAARILALAAAPGPDGRDLVGAILDDGESDE